MGSGQQKADPILLMLNNPQENDFVFAHVATGHKQHKIKKNRFKSIKMSKFECLKWSLFN